ncbi:hypothetical protein [Cohnella fermenti]|uniref:Uncharacterized protein n=1 Tax=Cohnella fermenti TaxID=2565925 RepID=A0A4S4C6F8_9BACL|nr:hypothetical protein [Cohnella fermenti]THF83481.1 hypothetical protein E6C55_04790 [Cohnella fermenti]
MGVFMVFIGIVVFLIGLLILEYVIRSAINASRTSTRLDEVVWELQMLRRELATRDERDRKAASGTGQMIDAEA